MEDWIDLQPSHPNPPEIPLPGTSETKLHVNGGGVGGGGRVGEAEERSTQSQSLFVNSRPVCVLPGSPQGIMVPTGAELPAFLREAQVPLMQGGHQLQALEFCTRLIVYRLETRVFTLPVSWATLSFPFSLSLFCHPHSPLPSW